MNWNTFIRLRQLKFYIIVHCCIQMLCLPSDCLSGKTLKRFKCWHKNTQTHKKKQSCWLFRFVYFSFMIHRSIRAKDFEYTVLNHIGVCLFNGTLLSVSGFVCCHRCISSGNCEQISWLTCCWTHQAIHRLSFWSNQHYFIGAKLISFLQCSAENHKEYSSSIRIS